MTIESAVNLVYPDYYKQITPIIMQDNLARVLGASDGYFEYQFIDAVKTAGHSCPSIAGAWMQTVVGLKALFANEIPTRGLIHVAMKGREDDGHTGAMANVISMITGATHKQGFGGLFRQPQTNRQALLTFNNDSAEGPLYTIFTRLDEQQAPVASVKVLYNPHVVPPKPEMIEAMQKIRAGAATDADKAQFAKYWQERVQRIMIDNFQKQVNPEMIRTEECSVDAGKL